VSPSVFNQSFSEACLVKLSFTQDKTVLQFFKKLLMYMFRCWGSHER